MTEPLLPAPDSVPLPLLGAQLSTSGGWSRVPERALAIGAEVVQTFSSNPRVWPISPPDSQSLFELAAALRRHRLPLFMHAIYLINPASPDEKLRQRSTAALTHALTTAALGEAAGVVTHLGSHRGEGFDKATPWVLETLRTARAQAERDAAVLILERSPAATPSADTPFPLPPILLETGAGSGATVGGTLAELQTLLASLDTLDDNSPMHFGLCLDTAHMHAAGYPLHEEDGLAHLVAELEERDLLRRLRLVHLNDSASELGSRRDRHANPGEGRLTHTGMMRLVRHPSLAHIPFVLEVPGSDGHGPGRPELDTVKTMRQGVPPRRQPPVRREADPEGLT